MFYAGDADVAGGKTAETIAADTATLLAAHPQDTARRAGRRHRHQAEPAALEAQETIRKANALVKAAIKGDALAAFADVEAALLGADGQPRPEFYQDERPQPERGRLPGVDRGGAAGDRADADRCGS